MKPSGGTRLITPGLPSPTLALLAIFSEVAMAINEGDYHTRILLLQYLNISMVMDQARADPAVLAKLIARLESRGEDNLTPQEKDLLQWGRSTELIQGKE